MKLLTLFCGPELDLFSDSAQAIHWRELVCELRSRGHQLLVVSRRAGSLDGLEVLEEGEGGESLRQKLLAFRPDRLLERYFIESRLGYDLGQLGVPRYVEANMSLVHGSEAPRPYAADPEWEAQERHLLSNCNGIVTISSVMKGFLVRRYGIDESRIHVFPLGVDLNRLRPAGKGERPGGRSRGTVCVGFVGSFKQYHDTDMLINLARSVCAREGRVRFLLVGAGPGLPEAKEALRELAVQGRVQFVGLVPNVQIPSWLRRMDVAVMPGREHKGDGVIDDFHGFPIKILEYMAVGLAAVLPEHGEPARQFRHGEDAFFYRPGDVRDMAEKTLALVGDASGRQRVARNALRTVTGRFQIANSIDAIEKAWG